ncbi:MAG: MinD/ParA family protein [Clostridiales bacterium]|jgi:flagellar biosynthesis protein FlhG|nr:MinD/ParA family protein [Clostridiales bacterium]
MTDQAESLRSAIRERAFREPADSRSASARVVAVASGKGGVGKSNITVNLAITLASAGKRVVVIDADFGLANIEILLGVVPEYSLRDVCAGRADIRMALTEGPLGARFISGGSGFSGGPGMGDAARNKVIQSFMFLDRTADIIIIDTGAGISENVVGVLAAAGETVVVTTPEPTSVADAYGLIKAACAADPGRRPDFSVFVNRAEDAREARGVYERLDRASRRFLSMPLRLIGWAPNDPNVARAVKRRQAAAIAYPDTAFTRAVRSAAMDMIGQSAPERGGLAGFISKLFG